MKKLYVLSQKKPYGHVLVRQVTWWLCFWGNLKFYFSPSFKSVRYWHWNIQLLAVGTTKFNGCVKFRVLNWELEWRWG